MGYDFNCHLCGREIYYDDFRFKINDDGYCHTCWNEIEDIIYKYVEKERKERGLSK